MRRTRLVPVLLALLTGAAALACTSSGAAAPSDPATTATQGTAATTKAPATSRPVDDDVEIDEDDTTTTSRKKGTASGSADASDELPGVDADGQITDATVIREFLFNTIESWGEQALDPQELAEGLNVTFPSLDLSGYQVESTPTRVSLLSTTLDEKGDPSADNPYVIAFTVMQVDGTCEGGVIYGYPVPTERMQGTASARDRCVAMSLYEATVPNIRVG